jgi:flagellar operon protein
MIDRLQSSQSLTNQPSIQKEQVKPKVGRQFSTFIDEALEKTSSEVLANDRVIFSKHAQKRLEQHGFQLTEDDVQKVGEAVEAMKEKGSNDSLILYDDLALIASIKNRTVITALRSSEISQVTNIDSVIQVKNN